HGPWGRKHDLGLSRHRAAERDRCDRGQPARRAARAMEGVRWKSMHGFVLATCASRAAVFATEIARTRFSLTRQIGRCARSVEPREDVCAANGQRRRVGVTAPRSTAQLRRSTDTRWAAPRIRARIRWRSVGGLAAGCPTPGGAALRGGGRARGADPPRQERAAGEDEPAELIERLTALRQRLLEEAEGWHPWVEGGDADRDASARNLLQYLALRGHDLRELQDPLAELGLSSLGRTEGHVQATIDAVLDALNALVRYPPPPRPSPASTGFARSRTVLAGRTAALLGPVPRTRTTRIMVTMPTEAADDEALVREMLVAGMDCMRINCAHDTAPQWRAMCDNLRLAEAETGRRARVAGGLPG